MPRYLFLILLMLACYTSSTFAQTKSIFLNGSSAWYDRILGTQTELTDTEVRFLKGYERLRWSYAANIGFNYAPNDRFNYDISLGFDRMLFGSRRFTVPPWGDNITPQTNIESHAMVFHYLGLNLGANMRLVKFCNITLEGVVGLSILKYWKYKHKTQPYDFFGEPFFKISRTYRFARFPEWNFLNCPISERNWISIAPIARVYWINMNTFRNPSGDGGGYFYFKDKRTVGKLYSMGIELRYQRVIGHKKR
jgi:hypothetical protein